MSLYYNYLIEMGFDDTGKKCACGAPLVMRGEWVGCWECLTSGEVARRGRRLLDQMKGRLEIQKGPQQWIEGMSL